jgi:STIP1 family protein 1
VFVFKAQAQYELQHPNEALTSAITAYDICARSKTQTSNAFSIAQFVLKCKKAKWDLRERDRLRRRSQLLKDLETRLEADQQEELNEIQSRVQTGELGDVGAMEESSAVKQSWQTKIHDLRTAFAISDPTNLEQREVPEHLIDPISFEIMHDPVITKTGQSYERATIVEHLKRNPTDPLSRDSLMIHELRPNVNLKKACDEFWEGNKGWAYHW